MFKKPIIVVVGATGAQGGSVLRFLAKDGKYHIRGITRDPNSAKAQKLKSEYPEVELVKASLDDETSLRTALEGAYGVFGVTNFWEPGTGYDGEVRQGKALVDAAKSAGVKHFIWSTLDNGNPQVPHFMSKWEVDEYLKASGLSRTSFYTGFYIENILTIMAPKKIGEDTYLIPLPALPDAPNMAYPVNDTGAWVTAAFNDPDTWIGKDMRVVTEWLSTREMAKIASRVSGKNVVPLELDEEAFKATKDADYPGAEEIYLNFLFFAKHGPDSGARDQEMTLRLYPNATNFEKLVKENVATLFP